MLQVRPMSSAPALGSVSGVCPLVIGLPPSYVCGNVNVLHVQQEGGRGQWRRCAARGGVTLAAVALRLLLLLMLLLCCCCCTAFKRLRDLFMLPLHFGSNDPSSNPSGPRPHACPAAMALCKLASCLNIKTMRPTERPMYS